MAKSENVRKMIENRKKAAPAAEPPKIAAPPTPATEHLSVFAPCRECGKLLEGVVDGACPGCRKVAADLAGETAAAAETFLDSQGTVDAEIEAATLAIGEQAVADAHRLPPAEPLPITGLAAAVEGGSKKKPLKERFRKTIAAAASSPAPGTEIAAEADRVQVAGFSLTDEDRRHLLEANPERAVMILRVAEISEHPDNPRLVYPRIKELAADVEENGLRDPIKVRPIPGGYQVLSGHRRLRAVQDLGWKEIPATLERLNDLDAYERLVVENEHREDLTGIEEGVAFQGLIDRGQTAEQIAKLVGKSVAHVYARMKLTALCVAGRKAMTDGWLSAETALLVARIPTVDLQERALKEIGPAGNKPKNDALSYRQALQHIQTHYMLLLSKASFDRKSIDLLPIAGACSDCPKRSGALPAALRSDIKGADVCLDRECYGQKTAAAWALTRAAAPEGMQVIDAAEAEKRHLVYHGEQLAEHNGVCSLESTCHDDDSYRTWAKILPKKNIPEPDVLIQSPHTGAPLKGWKRETLLKAAIEAKVLKPSTTGKAPADEKEAAIRKKLREDRKVAHAAIAKIMEKPAKLLAWPVELWRALAEQSLEHTWASRIAKRRGKDVSDLCAPEALKKLETSDCIDLVLEAMLQRAVESMLAPCGDKNQRPFRAMIQALGVDWLAAQALAAGPDEEEDEPEEKKPAPAKKSAAKGPLARKLKK